MIKMPKVFFTLKKLCNKLQHDKNRIHQHADHDALRDWFAFISVSKAFSTIQGKREN